MKTFMLFLFTFMWGTQSYSNDIIDIYGVDNAVANRILKKYAPRIKAIETQLSFLFLHQLPNNSEATRNALFRKKETLIQTIKREEHASFVDIQTVKYPNTADIFTTVEIIDKDHPQRLKFVAPIIMTPQHPTSHDIIHQMQVYENLALTLIMSHKEPAITRTCPAFHCLSEFKHPQLKPYLELFNHAAIHQRAFILKTLEHDPDPERRAAAAFLVGHFHDPHDILRILSNHVTDPDSTVRNNVIRVIGATMDKTHITSINVEPFIALLDSPYVSDRNKALFVLLKAAKTKRNRDTILQHAKDPLLATLSLKQPNNHDIAYLILKELSGQSFGEYDLAAWNRWWLNEQKHSHNLT